MNYELLALPSFYHYPNTFQSIQFHIQYNGSRPHDSQGKNYYGSSSIKTQFVESVCSVSFLLKVLGEESFEIFNS